MNLYLLLNTSLMFTKNTLVFSGLVKHCSRIEVQWSVQQQKLVLLVMFYKTLDNKQAIQNSPD